MSDLIDRQNAIDAIMKKPAWHNSDGSFYHSDDICKALSELPPAQPERSIGYWQITDAYPHNVYCSKCHARFAQTNWAVWEDGSLPRKFCPNCGAKMSELAEP